MVTAEMSSMEAVAQREGAEQEAERQAPSPAPGGRVLDFIRLARPHQWTKGGFVLIGPAFGLAFAEPGVTMLPLGQYVLSALGAFLVFGFSSSACYVLNDLKDREADRAHPRKRRRPLAAGRIGTVGALWWAAALIAMAGLATMLVAPQGRLWLTIAALVYLLNTTAYSLWLKHASVVDVLSLSAGFVLRVLGGCAAVLVEPSTWLLNCTLFLAMFLALGKRLGERRTMGSGAATVRGVQSAYTDEFLRMAVVVSAVATLVTYAGYVQDQAERFVFGFNLLWLTILPATYALLRCIVLVERGLYDDPTELAGRDRPFQAAVALYGAILVALIALSPSAGPV